MKASGVEEAQTLAPPNAKCVMCDGNVLISHRSTITAEAGLWHHIISGLSSENRKCARGNKGCTRHATTPPCVFCKPFGFLHFATAARGSCIYAVHTAFSRN